MKEYAIPGLYLQGFVKQFSSIVAQYDLQLRCLNKGEVLTDPGRINNTAHYVQSGIMHLSLSHSSGKIKSLNLYGPGTIFPLGVVPHENRIDYELILQAFTDLEVYSFSYQVLRQICVEKGELAAQVLEQNCEFIGYMFYRDMNQTFSSSFSRVCDILYLYISQLYKDKAVIELKQEELANLGGMSKAQLERCLRALREKKIIQTDRNYIKVVDKCLLLKNCTNYIRNYDMTAEVG